MPSKIWDLLGPVRKRVNDEKGTLSNVGSLRIALCHPSPYKVGMSSLGFQTLYREMNLHMDVSAERSFLPDNPGEYRKNRSPVFTYENETPLNDFPIIAFSISYELEISGLLEILDLSGIPVLRRQRKPAHPLIVAGGPLTNSNPFILAPFVDVIILGEGEDLIHSLLDALLAMDRKSLLDRFSKIPGCYVPDVSRENPTIAKVPDDRLPAYSQIVTPNAVWASMFLIEAERGCSRECAYCVMRRSTGGPRKNSINMLNARWSGPAWTNI